MAAAAVTIHNFPSDGSYKARGKSTAFNDADTIDTGLPFVSGFMGIASTADTVVTMTSQSSGVVTVAAKTAGGAAAAQTIYWVAWCDTIKG